MLRLLYIISILSISSSLALATEYSQGTQEQGLSKLHAEMRRLQAENEKLKQKPENIQLSDKEGVCPLELTERLQELSEENRNLASILARTQETGLSFPENEVENFKALEKQVETLTAQNKQLQLLAKSKPSKELGENTKLQNRIQEMTQENKVLRLKIEELSQSKQASASSTSEAEYNTKIRELKAQNESLRDTIEAQTHSLLSSDNAGQTAERLLTENRTLLRKLEMAAKADDARELAAKDIMARNQNLHSEITKRDEYIQKLKNHILTNSEPADVEMLQERNKSLEEALKRERDNTITYKTKIREYQTRIEQLNTFEGSVSTDEITALKLENQDLKARLRLLNEAPTPQSIEPSSGVLSPQGGKNLDNIGASQ